MMMIGHRVILITFINSVSKFGDITAHSLSKNISRIGLFAIYILTKCPFEDMKEILYLKSLN